MLILPLLIFHLTLITMSVEFQTFERSDKINFRPLMPNEQRLSTDILCGFPSCSEMSVCPVMIVEVETIVSTAANEVSLDARIAGGKYISVGNDQRNHNSVLTESSTVPIYVDTLYKKQIILSIVVRKQLGRWVMQYKMVHLSG